MTFPSAVSAHLLALLCSGALPYVGDTGHLRAPRDPIAPLMGGAPPSIRPDLQAADDRYFTKSIPRVIHQIWFGNAQSVRQETVEAWQQFARQFGYTYRLWGDDDREEFGYLLAAEDLAMFDKYRHQGDYWAASDILRLNLLAEIGGVYADLDIMPPSIDGEWVDLAAIVPMQNMVTITERDSRSVNDSSLFVGNNFMMAAAHHPLVQHLRENLLANTLALNECESGQLPAQLRVPAMYATGTFYISRNLAGVFTMLPYNYARAYGMLSYDALRGLFETSRLE